MDDKSRGVDRADILRALQKTLARGNPQVLQLPMRAGASLENQDAESIKRGPSYTRGCPDDLRERCGHCGAVLHGTVRKQYCNTLCRRAAYKAKRREARAGRKCLWCSGPIPIDKPRAIYCGKACQSKSGQDIAKKKNKRACDQCGKVFFAAPGKRFCCHPCYAESKRTRPLATCPECGSTFRRLKPDQKTCSMPCYRARRFGKA